METATATRERPILFNGDMVRAILDGRKVQTRRVVNPQPPADIDELHGGELSERAPYTLEHHETGVIVGSGFEDEDGTFYKCPYGQPGDHLYIRTGCTATYNVNRNQTWWSTSIPGCGRTTHGHPRRSDGTPMKLRNGCASMYTPKWLSLEVFPVLEVTDVRVERVQDISEADVAAEGSYLGRCECIPFSADRSPVERAFRQTGCHIHGAEFTELWDSINGKRPGCSWAENPFVWVIEFKQI